MWIVFSLKFTNFFYWFFYYFFKLYTYIFHLQCNFTILSVTKQFYKIIVLFKTLFVNNIEYCRLFNILTNKDKSIFYQIFLKMFYSASVWEWVWKGREKVIISWSQICGYYMKCSQLIMLGGKTHFLHLTIWQPTFSLKFIPCNLNFKVLRSILVKDVKNLW